MALTARQEQRCTSSAARPGFTAATARSSLVRGDRVTGWATTVRAATIMASIAVCAVLGCADLQPMEVRECGNGVVEEGEDCDLAVDPALGEGTLCGMPTDSRACRYICGENAACPAGWGCGLDGVCRHAVGQFGEVVSTSLQGVRAWSVGRVDEDQVPDLLVALDRNLQVHLGDGQGGFSPADTLTLPRQTGPPAFVDLDADGRLDAVVLLETGVLTVHSGEGGRLVPTLGQPFELREQASSKFAVAQIEGVASDVLVALVQDSTEHGDLAALFFSSPISEDLPIGGAVALPPLDLGDLAGGSIPRANLRSDGGAEDTLALAFEGSASVLLLQTVLDGGGAPDAIVTSIPLPAGKVLDASGVLFAQVDGDGLPDLLVSAPGEVLVAYGHGDGTFEDMVVDPRFEALGSVPWPRAAADFDGDGVADYVGRTGVFLADDSGGLVQVECNTDDTVWDQVVVADLNQDAWPDLAVSSRTTLSLPVRGVDLLFNNPGGSFTRRHVDTAGAVRALVSADFDSDFASDVALVEDLKKDAQEVIHNRVSVIFGQHGSLPSSAVAMGEFEASIDQIVPGRLAVGTGESEVAPAVLATVRAADGTSRFWILWGGNEQRLLAPTSVGNRPQIVVPGRFDAPSSGDPDLLLIADDDDSCAARLFDSEIQPLASWDDLTFDALCSFSRAADLDNDGVDEWIAIPSEAVAAECGAEEENALWVTRFSHGSGVTQSAPLVGHAGYPDDVVLDDFDGDGYRDLAVSYEGASPSKRGLSVYWNDVGVFDGVQSTAFRGPGLQKSGALVGALNSDGDPVRELAFLGSFGMHLIELGSDRYPTYSDALLLELDVRTFASVRAADLTGDGVEDLLLERTALSLDVYPGVSHTSQCVVDESAQLIFLNRHGGSYRRGDDDSSDNTSSILPMDADLLPLAGGLAWDELVACVEEAFAGFRVRVTEEDPGDVDHLEIVLTGSTAAAFGLDPGVTTLSAHLCDGVPRGTGFVFAPAIWPDMPGRCAAATAAAGTLLGLEWTVQSGDFMSYDFDYPDKAFRNVDAACGTTAPTTCTCAGTMQNSYRRLLEKLGETTCQAE